MSNPILKFFYTNSVSIELKNKSVLDAVKFILSEPVMESHIPLKCVFESTGKTLYFNHSSFSAFANGEMELPELIANTECEGLFRNQVDIRIIKTETIDAGSLWILKKGIFILISDENHIEVKAPNSNFTEL